MMQPHRFRLPLARLALAGAATLLPALVSAQNVRNLAGFRANTLQANDDASSSAISLGFAAPIDFFGTTYTQLYVNNNGNITFGAPLTTFTPFGLTSATGTPIIAAFFADVDTRGDASASVGRFNATPQPYAGSGLVTYGTATVNGHAAFGVNYFSDCAAFTGVGAATCTGLRGVGGYGLSTDLTDVFQLILVDRSDIATGAFDIEFNYDQVQWDTGAASSGASARVGYSAGTGAAGTHAELAGSGENGAFLDGGARSLAAQGRIAYAVRSGGVSQVPATTTTTPEPATIVLTASGLLALAGVARRTRRAA